MSFENKAGLNVSNHYGQRYTGGSVGSETTDGSTRSYSFTITGESVNSGFVPQVRLPKGSFLKDRTLRVDEAFSISAGGTVTITGEGSDLQILSETDLENVGTKVPSTAAAGNWASNSTTGTTASEVFNVLKTGTVSRTQGKATLILTFVNKTKV